MSEQAAAYAEKMTKHAEEIFQAWARGEVEKVKMILNSLTPLEAATVMLMAYKGLNKFDQSNFSISVGALAGGEARERDTIPPSANPFSIESIDWNEYALWTETPNGGGCYIMTQLGASMEEARHFMAQRMGDLVRAAPER